MRSAFAYGGVDNFFPNNQSVTRKEQHESDLHVGNLKTRERKKKTRIASLVPGITHWIFLPTSFDYTNAASSQFLLIIGSS